MTSFVGRAAGSLLHLNGERSERVASRPIPLGNPVLRPRNDDPEIHFTIDFLPMADSPVPVEQKTWSEVKGLFRE
jgi:hypothetical protein